MEIPSQLKSISHFLKVAAEHEQRDRVVAYWARFHGTQKALSIDKTSPECKLFIIQMLDVLEGQKIALADNEAITNEAIAEAHLENYALKLFKYADDCDRSGQFNKNVVKAFYTSSILIDILSNFNSFDPSEFEKIGKYAKWKAAYIHNCLKNGETPTAGPVGGEEHPFEHSMGGVDNIVPVEDNMPVTQEQQQPPPTEPNPTHSTATITLAQKHCKWASSALNFDDIPTAIENLKKALELLE